MTLTGFTILRPWWLLVLPVAIGIAWFIRQRAPLGTWLKVFDPLLLSVMMSLGRVSFGTAPRTVIPAFISIMLTLAMAGPALHNAQLASYRNLDGLVIAVDLSGSVTQAGLFREALTTARLVADEAKARPVALIVYSGDAYIASNFTTDVRVLSATIGVLDAETVPDKGSLPDQALALASRMFTEANMLAGDVVLVSDGGGIGAAALHEASALNRAGKRVLAIAVPAANNRPENAPPTNLDALNRLATAGGGFIADTFVPDPVVTAVADGTAQRLAAAGFSLIGWRDLGWWLLWLVLPATILLFRRNA